MEECQSREHLLRFGHVERYAKWHQDPSLTLWAAVLLLQHEAELEHAALWQRQWQSFAELSTVARREMAILELQETEHEDRCAAAMGPVKELEAEGGAT